MARLRLWHSVDTRSLRVLWTFEELNLKRGRDYALKTLPFPPRQHRPEFLVEQNILGTVPWFVHREPHDANGPRASMSESCAVPLYLTEHFKYPDLSVRIGEADHGAFLNWLFHADATLTFPQSIVMRYGIHEPGRADVAAEDYAKWYIARLRLLSNALNDGRQFLCAGRMTIADICVGYALHCGSKDGLAGSGLAAAGKQPLCAFYKDSVRDYLDRMRQRPAWKAAQAAQILPDDF